VYIKVFASLWFYFVELCKTKKNMNDAKYQFAIVVLLSVLKSWPEGIWNIRNPNSGSTAMMWSKMSACMASYFAHVFSLLKT
jgi:hypothetical protein